MKNLPTLARGSLALAAGALALTLSSPASAALDEVLSDDASDVHVEKVAGQSLRVRVQGNLKEFAGADGHVFAATWSGRVDLVSLFGSHFASYQAALRARTVRSHHVVRVSTPELTVSAVAYGRLFEGKVVLNQRLPEGVSYEALR